MKFQRQHPIGPYIVDFCCHAERVVIELDGGGHYEPEQAAYDARRTQYLAVQGYTVLRRSNLDISRTFSGVRADLL